MFLWRVLGTLDRVIDRTKIIALTAVALVTFVGTYATQNFGSSVVGGLRLGYHITEDFFVEGVYAQTKVSDSSFRQGLPGGVFPDEKEKLSYYNLSVGYNVLPGGVPYDDTLRRLFQIGMQLKLHVLSPPVNRSINNHTAQPGLKRFICRKTIKGFKNLYKSIVYSFHGVVPVVAITQTNAHGIAIETFIQHFLVF